MMSYISNKPIQFINGTVHADETLIGGKKKISSWKNTKH